MVRVDESVVGSDGDGLVGGGEFKLNLENLRDGGADVDVFAVRGEAGLIDGDAVAAPRQALDDEVALIVGVEGGAVIVGVTEDVDQGSYPSARGIGDLNTQLAAVGLREYWPSA